MDLFGRKRINQLDKEVSELRYAFEGFVRSSRYEAEPSVTRREHYYTMTSGGEYHSYQEVFDALIHHSGCQLVKTKTVVGEVILEKKTKNV